MSADFSELRELSADFGRATSGVLDEVDKTVKKAAQNLKEDYRSQAEASSFRGMSRSFSYDRLLRIGKVSYEVGPDKSRTGGPLGNLFFFGGAHGGGGTGDLDGPLADEEPRLTSALGDILEDRARGK